LALIVRLTSNQILDKILILSHIEPVVFNCRFN
jgi:hypothetical protein